MSLLGQSRHFDRLPDTSGLPRSTDILSVCRHVSKVPKGDKAQCKKSDLFDQLVRDAE
jgi:hypothetical protein